MTLRTIVWPTVMVMAVFSCVMFFVTFPSNFPDETLRIEEEVREFFSEITLPIKLLRLSLQEPDAEILMPVYGAKVSEMQDTWGAPRGGGRVHEGQDVFAPRGTPIFSGTDGYVLFMRTTELGGNNIMIAGAGGIEYYYSHLDRFPLGLHRGQWVTTDTVIGFVGNTGNAINTPPHLHFGMYQGRKALDPLDLLVDRQ